MVMRLRTRNKATPVPPQKGPTALGQGSTMDPSHQGTSTVASGVSKPRVVLVKEAPVLWRLTLPTSVSTLSSTLHQGSHMSIKGTRMGW